MADIKYRYALDENNKLIDCQTNKDIAPNLRRLHSYHCLGCGEEMVFSIRNKPRALKFFKHKADCSCDGETYRHRSGKFKIKEWFEDKSKCFGVEFHEKIYCKNKDKCPRYREMVNPMKLTDKKINPYVESGVHESKEKCVIHKFNKYDLHDHNYISCTEEKTVKTKNGTFIADLLLENSKLEEDPILIEVCVTHPCTQEKIDSGFRIIEVKIETEDTIDEICKNGYFVESENVKFYNFKSQSEYVGNEVLDLEKAYRFIYKNEADWKVKPELVSCADFYKKESSDSLIEINYPTIHWSNVSSILYNSVQLLNELGYKIRSCYACKYFSKRLYRHKCNLQGKKDKQGKLFNVPFKTDKPHEAVNCFFFRQDKLYMPPYKPDKIIPVEEYFSEDFFVNKRNSANAFDAKLIDKPQNKKRKTYARFVLKESGVWYTAKNEIDESKLHVKLEKDSIIELNLPYSKADGIRFYETYAAAYLLNKGYNLSYCYFCKNYYNDNNSDKCLCEGVFKKEGVEYKVHYEKLKPESAISCMKFEKCGIIDFDKSVVILV